MNKWEGMDQRKLNLKKGDLFIGTDADLSLFKRIKVGSVNHCEFGSRYLVIPVFDMAVSVFGYDYVPTSEETTKLLFERKQICMDVWEFIEERK